MSDDGQEGRYHRVEKAPPETHFEVVIPFPSKSGANASKRRLKEHPDFGYSGIEVRKVNPDAVPVADQE